jgi:CRISPR-associated exonuclease Cas4
MTTRRLMDDVLQLPLSALNQYAYCPRRCYLIHAEGEFRDNLHTVRGTLEHERVDQSESRGQDGVRIEYALPVWSDSLGLSGRCDVVEFHPEGSIYPVEYKHGKRKQWINDDLQLAAQAFCLEEMTGKPVPLGAIFHQQSKRRREVAITGKFQGSCRLSGLNHAAFWAWFFASLGAFS